MKSYDWITPPDIVKALGEFDLDPCAALGQPWPMAKQQFTIIDDGLNKEWFGRVFCNPPYGDFAQIWAERIAWYRNGILLIPSRTGSPWFHRQVFEKADSILFLEDRIWFYDINGIKARGNAGHDTVLLSYGRNNVDALAECKLKGAHRYNLVVPIVVVGISPSWKSVVTIAMTRLGEADIQVIYDVVEQIAPDKCEANQHYKEKIRQQLQYHFNRLKKGYYSCTSQQQTDTTPAPVA
jgi:hypothetical protein